MDDVLIIGDTTRCPELRHEIPLLVPDPFVYLEVDGARHVYVGAMEVDRIREAAPDATVHPLEEIGRDELVAQGLSNHALAMATAVRAAADAGLHVAVVPSTFPAGQLDALRAAGVELTVDQALFDRRRRVKTARELEGIRRAQRAAEAGFAAALELLRSAGREGDLLVLDGVPLTVERVKARMAAVFEEYGCPADDFVVAPGPQGAQGHHMGSGAIPADTPIVIDVWPRDRDSACFADMTRTVVVGTPSEEIWAWHELTRTALEAARALVEPGRRAKEVFEAVCDVYEAAGHQTGRTKTPGVPLHDGFFHGLGHGVGLDVHEPPSLGRVEDGELIVGDVITLEPGTYRKGFGGVRLEDLVLVTESGCETLTEASYDLEV